MKNIIKNKWVMLVLVLLIGIVIGKFLGGGTSKESNNEHAHDESTKSQIWTCSMHPQIQLDGPGKCPLCGMDLIPLDNSSENEETYTDEVVMTASAMKLAEIQTFIVKREKPEKEIRLLGKVKADERLMFSQVIHFPGRIEKLFINFTGEKVYKGQKLASIYSAELVTAQKELFEVLKDSSSNSALTEAAKSKLKQWKFTDEQISDIEMSGEVKTEIDILSDYDGYVMTRMVAEGDHIKAGQILFQITDLKQVWVLFEAYENDIPWIKLGDDLEIELISIPGSKFNGKVAFIDPFINPETRVVYVRVELSNSKGLLKPDMFANGIITSLLPINEEVILVPKSAVLWTGKRGIVYVKIPNKDHNSFIYREVILGEDAGDYYIIKEGLREGEEIAINGVFKIDAAAQLSGKKSMMNPKGGKVSTSHKHGDMDKENPTMGISKMKSPKEALIDKSKIPSEFKKQLGLVVGHYLALKNKLTNDDSNVIKETKSMQTAVSEVDMGLVLENAHLQWMVTSNTIKKDLNLLSKTTNIIEQRIIFTSISNALIDVVKKLGVKTDGSKLLYVEFCPMANKNHGGYWLSDDKEIKNPYFGAAMLNCGEIRDSVMSN